ncbi:hypothetical protein N0V93_008953 [Gnomoniopsis smithogilvyi]|uniref:Uncharacterized protein n=1 Tax=Gnomoniopsis smithogilvyi TaxID=1191159 RepID=A0A9W8YJI8_9PEZI|nr:hypothetical protein N0V93_008953 [Gnomoniopsis smithogilvyi]
MILEALKPVMKEEAEWRGIVRYHWSPSQPTLIYLEGNEWCDSGLSLARLLLETSSEILSKPTASFSSSIQEAMERGIQS